jgi:hypothetical protein
MRHEGVNPFSGQPEKSTDIRKWAIHLKIQEWICGFYYKSKKGV